MHSDSASSVCSHGRHTCPANPTSRQLSQAFEDIDELDLLSERDISGRRRIATQQASFASCCRPPPNAQVGLSLHTGGLDLSSPRESYRTTDASDVSEQQLGQLVDDGDAALPRLRRRFSGLQPAFLSEDTSPASSPRGLPGRYLRRIRKVRALPALDTNADLQSLSEFRSHCETARRRSLSSAMFASAPPSVRAAGTASSEQAPDEPVSASPSELQRVNAYGRGTAFLESASSATTLSILNVVLPQTDVGSAMRSVLLEAGAPDASAAMMLDSHAAQNAEAIVSFLKDNFVASDQEEAFAREMQKEVQQQGITGVEALTYVFKKRFGTLKNAFAWLDFSGHGHFTRVALETAMLLLHIDVETLTGLKSQEIFSNMDTRRTATVSRDDWARFFGLEYSELFGIEQEVGVNQLDNEIVQRPGGKTSTAESSDDSNEDGSTTILGEEFSYRESHSLIDESSARSGVLESSNFELVATDSIISRSQTDKNALNILSSNLSNGPSQEICGPISEPSTRQSCQSCAESQTPHAKEDEKRANVYKGQSCGLASLVREVERRSLPERRSEPSRVEKRSEPQRRSEPSKSVRLPRRNSTGMVATKRGPASKPHARLRRATLEHITKREKEQEIPENVKELPENKKEQQPREDEVDDEADENDEADEDEEEEDDEDFCKRVRKELLELREHGRRVYTEVQSPKRLILQKVVRELNMWSTQKGSDVIVLRLPDRDSILHSLR